MHFEKRQNTQCSKKVEIGDCLNHVGFLGNTLEKLYLGAQMMWLSSCHFHWKKRGSGINNGGSCSLTLGLKVHSEMHLIGPEMECIITLLDQCH